MVLKLPDLQGFPIVGPDGKPTPYFERLWSDMKSKLENEVGALQAAAAAQAAADAADAAAAAANTAAAAAQTAADDAATANAANQALIDLNNSFITSQPLTSTDAGTDADIVIAAHVRRYGSGNQVNVTGATLHGYTYSTDQYVYYDDPARAGGAVTYHTTTTIATASPSTANPDRHYVGAITTAAAGVPSTGAGAVFPNFEAPSIGFNYN